MSAGEAETRACLCLAVDVTRRTHDQAVVGSSLDLTEDLKRTRLFGRFDHHYWDGQRWTEHIASQGDTSTDPMP